MCPAVSDDLNRRGAEPHEPLPELAQRAYTLLGADWRETARQWRDAGHAVPPVMLTVRNRTETRGKGCTFIIEIPVAAAELAVQVAKAER